MASEEKKRTGSSEGKKRKSKTKEAKSNEEIVNGFQTLRSEQRHMANKLSELEVELHEHKLVIETLKEADGDRKCFRMIGGILCEKTVKEVLPALESNKQQLEKFIESLNEQVTKKGQEINEYREKHNIRVRGPADDQPSGETQEGGDAKPTRTGNVLVPI